MNILAWLAKFFIIEWGISIPMLLIVTGILLLILLFWPIKYTIKLKFFWFAYLVASIYIGFYILSLLICRIIYINKELDLKKYSILIHYFIKFINIYSFPINIIAGFGIILLCLIWIFLFIKIRQILSWKCWQLHFYWHNAVQTTDPFEELPRFKNKPYFYTNRKYYRLYTNTINRFYLKYSLVSLYDYIVFKPKTIESKFNIKNKFLISALNKIKNITLNKFALTLRYGVLILLLILFGSECYFNNFVLHYTVYYLLFYMIFVLWYRISFAFYNQDIILDQMIFEIAYCEPEILYVNLTEKEELELANHIKNPSDRSTQTPISDCIVRWMSILHPIKIHRRYFHAEMSPNQIVWANNFRDPDRSIYFEQEDLKTINHKHFVREQLETEKEFQIRIKNFNFNKKENIK